MHEPNWTLTRKRTNLEQRARIITAIRAFFNERGYFEVETPHRIPANAPEVHIDPIATGDWFLHTSPEIAMKRLLSAGYDRIFQICRVWRDAERGQRHLPEFTMLEWYRSGIDYYALMDECESLLQALVPGTTLTCQGTDIDTTSPWERLTVAEAFGRYASKTLEDALAEDMFEELLTAQVEPQLGKAKPTFLTEYPASMAALARKKPSNPDVAERFELYIGGIELANAFSELTDPQEQRSRFEHDQRVRRENGKGISPLPERFLNEMSTLTAAAGIALGVDRLVMLLTNVKSIDDVTALTPEDLV